jgi:hypothetical protein
MHEKNPSRQWPRRGPNVNANVGGIWTGIAAIALVAFLAVLLLMPWVEESKSPTTTSVEKTTPAPDGKQSPQQQ